MRNLLCIRNGLTQIWKGHYLQTKYFGRESLAPIHLIGTFLVGIENISSAFCILFGDLINKFRLFYEKLEL